jgi:rhodanese-related sulfurtransferase
MHGTAACPPVIDVRRRKVFDEARDRIPGALWRDATKAAEWGPALAGGRGLVVYCAHGHNVSEMAGALLARAGVPARVLDDGLDGWRRAGGAVAPSGAPGVEPGLAEPSVWVTRERPKIDRIACPWLIRRHFDPTAVFHFVKAEWVRDVAAELGAIPYDIEGVHYSHRGPLCTFDAMIADFGLADPALERLARIVRAADTGRPDDEPQAHGLLALSLGLSAIEGDDLVQLEKGMLFYDALFGWIRHASGERHNWKGGA